jgi:hypothetical protein
MKIGEWIVSGIIGFSADKRHALADCQLISVRFIVAAISNQPHFR